MPEAPIAPDLTIHYEDDDFADPWRPHETIVLLHGFAESGRSWFAWVPHLARAFRVLRPDLRGFGRSSVPVDGAAYPWSIAGFAQEIVGFLDLLGLDRVHLVGARVGAPIAIQIAADHPDRVRSLSLISGLVRGQDVRGLSAGDEVVSLADFGARIRRDGLAAWFGQTGASRLGPDTAPAQIHFWNDLMSGSDEGVCIGMMRAAALLDVSALLPQVLAPTLVVASERSSVQSIAATRAWQQRIPRSELVVLPGASPHLAATEPDECARRVVAFASRAHRSEPGSPPAEARQSAGA